MSPKIGPSTDSAIPCARNHATPKLRSRQGTRNTVCTNSGVYGRLLVDALHRQRHRVTAAQTERGDTSLLAAIGQRMQQRNEHAGAARADGMSEGNSAAVYVHAGIVP